MRKSTLFISAALTTFVLVMMVGVASAYQTIAKNNLVTPVVAQPEQAAPQPENANTFNAQLAQQPINITAEQAAQLAAQKTGKTDLYSVEATTWNGFNAFLVTFSSGDIVYVSPTGEILATTKLQQVASSGGGGGGGGGGHNKGSKSGGKSGGESEHEAGGGVEHEGGGDN